MSTQAVILAGGEGKRIRPLGLNKPKSMFEIMGKPLIETVIQNLRDVDIDDIIIVTGPNDNISKYLQDGRRLGVKIRYTIQTEPLGQANAIQTVEDMVDSPFFVLNANDIFDSSLLSEMMSVAKQEQAALVLAGQEVDDPSRFGVMSFENERLTGVVEKPPADQAPSNTAVIGVYYFSPDIFHYIHNTPLDTDDQLERSYQKMIDEGKGTYVSYNGAFESYKYPWDLLKISDLLLDRITKQSISTSAQIADGAIISGNVIIEDGVRVYEHAVIKGPAYIGAGSVVGNFTVIRGKCSFGPKCNISGDIKHVVFGRGVTTHMNFVGDSIVSDGCSFGAGTVTGNFRFDEQNVYTGFNKFGVIMAEGSKTGSNCTLMPGVKIGPNSIVFPGVTLMKDLPPNKVALLNKNSYRMKANTLDLVKQFEEK